VKKIVVLTVLSAALGLAAAASASAAQHSRSTDDAASWWLPSVPWDRSNPAISSFAPKVRLFASVRVIPCSKLKPPLPGRCKKKPAPTVPSLGRVVATISIPGVPADAGPIAYGAGALWVEDTEGVTRIDPQTNSVAARISFQSEGTYQLVATDDGVYVPDFGADTVTRINPADNTVAATIKLAARAAPVGIAAIGGAIWVANHHGQSISRIDPTTNTVVATIPIGGLPAGAAAGPSMMTVGAGSLWAGYPAGNAVVRIDPQTDTVLATIPVGAGSCVAELAADDAAVWATAAGCGDVLTRIDPSTNQATIPRPQPPATGVGGTAIVGTNLYLVGGPTPVVLLRIDQTTGKLTGRLALPGFSTHTDSGATLVYAAGSLWLHGPATLLQIQLTG
jgi:YVTN family beta-propeller protein